MKPYGALHLPQPPHPAHSLPGHRATLQYTFFGATLFNQALMWDVSSVGWMSVSRRHSFTLFHIMDALAIVVGQCANAPPASNSPVATLTWRHSVSPPWHAAGDAGRDPLPERLQQGCHSRCILVQFQVALWQLGQPLPITSTSFALPISAAASTATATTGVASIATAVP